MQYCTDAPNSQVRFRIPLVESLPLLVSQQVLRAIRMTRRPVDRLHKRSKINFWRNQRSIFEAIKDQYWKVQRSLYELLWYQFHITWKHVLFHLHFWYRDSSHFSWCVLYESLAFHLAINYNSLCSCDFCTLACLIFDLWSPPPPPSRLISLIWPWDARRASYRPPPVSSSTPPYPACRPRRA